MSYRPSGPVRVGRIGDWNSAPSSGDNNGSGNGRRVATLRDLGSSGPSVGGPPGRGPAPDDDDSDEDDDPSKEGESWFAGGERSGISVQNPDSRRPDNIPGGDAVREVLRRAAEAGPPPEVASRSAGSFIGGGHTLGSDEVESSYIPDPNAPQSEEETAIRNITFWADGFTIEDGELYRYDDPANSEILAALNAGHAPPSILNVLPGQPVELRIAKRIHENYVPPPKGAFSGSGNRLGAPVPGEASGSSTSSAPPPSAAPSSNPATGPGSIQARFEVDQSQPTTSVQIRLADGTRMVARMNLTHTVMDLRNFINASRPENLTRPYTIGTTFPNRILEDDNATIKDAGLVNSVVVQRWV